MVITANTLFANAILTNSITAAQIKANTITGNEILVNSITADKIDTRGLTIKAADGTVLFGSGQLSSSVTFFDGTSNVSVVSALSQNPVVFIGTYATAPSSGIKENNVYKNSTDGNTYVYKSGTWTTFVTGGTGSQGPAGPQGPAGAAGASGSPGERGYKEFIYGVAGLSSWNDTYAETAITNVGLTKVILDRVTLYNSSSPGSFSQSRFWSGSAWSPVSAYINGGLLVSGTIGADAIATNAVTANKILAGAITADKINVGSLSALSANIGVITTGKIQGDVVFSGNIYGANGTFSGSLTAAAINAVDTVNITNSAVTSVLSVKLNTPFVLNGYAAGGGSINPGGAIFKIDVLTTGWVKIPNQSSVTMFFTMNSYGQDTWQYLSPSITPEVRRETQYYRIRATYGGNGASPSAAVIANPWSSYTTPVDQPFRIVDRFTPPSDAIKVNQTTLGDGASGSLTAPGWYQFVVDMIVLPGPGSLDEQSFVYAHGGDISIVGTTDAVTAISNNQWTDRYGLSGGGPSTTYNYNNPNDVWGYGVFLVSNRPIYNAWYTGFPYLYHRFSSGSLTVIIAKK